MVAAILLIASVLAGPAPAEGSPSVAELAARLAETRAALQDRAARLDHLKKARQEVYDLRGRNAGVVARQLADEIARLQQEQAKLKADEAAIEAQLKQPRGQPPRPTTQPADQWLLMAGDDDGYRRHEAAEEVRAGELIDRSGGRGEFTPALKAAGGEIELIGAPSARLRPFAGQAVQVRGKPRAIELGGKRREFFWIGWLRVPPPPTSQPDQPDAWHVVDGDRQDYLALRAEPEEFEGILRREARGPNEQFVLVVGNDRIPLVGQPLKMGPFDGKRVQVRCRALAPRPERLSPRRVGWVRAAGAGEPPGEAWTPVAGESDSYRKTAGREVLVTGQLIAVNYGQPGVAYFRPPFNYYVQSGSGRLQLAPPMDGLFGKLDGRTVQVKGKRMPGPAGSKEDFLLVGWIRQVPEPRAEARGYVP